MGSHDPTHRRLDFLDGGGETGAIVRAYDWASSPLGPPETWPQPLKTALRLLLSTGHPMFIWWGPDLIQFYNDAYAPSIGPERHPSAIGQKGKECWAEIWDIIGPQIEQVMSGGGSTWHENQLVPITRNGRREEVYWTYSYGPIDDASAPSGVGGVLVVCTETTQAVLAKRRLSEEAAHWRRLFQQAPGFICILRGPEHVFEYVNDAYLRLFGDAAWIGKRVREAIPDLAGQGAYEALDRVFSTGERMLFTQAPARFRRTPDSPEELRYLDFIYAPITDGDGAISGIFCEGYDVTEAHAGQTHMRLMINELNHRVKNSLAIVQAIATQTLRRGEVPPEVRNTLMDRLLALAKAHDVLTDEKWTGANLHDIASQAVAPYVGRRGEERIVISGPPLNLKPKTAIALSLAIHELATNAVKYGALSLPSGRVSIDWTTEDQGQLTMIWRERGGPPVVAPARTGFGARLIERGLAVELNGRARIDYRPTGVVCTIEAMLMPEAEDGSPFMPATDGILAPH